MTVLLSAPGPVPAPPANPWPGVLQTWDGWDGSHWVISGDRRSGVRLKSGVVGLHLPAWKRYTRDSPAVPGSQFRGAVALEREVFWSVGVYQAEGSQAWLEYDRAWSRSLHVEHEGVWTVRLPTGERRSLRLRIDSDGTHAFATDPSRVGWANYAIALVASQPFWTGQPVVRSFQAAAPGGFFGAGAPPFTIGSGSTLGAATIDNPGDEPAWLTWRAHGPFESVQVGVGGRVVEVPFALAAGKHLTIATSPTEQTAFDSDGVERTGELGEVDFAAVPPGAKVELSLAMVGTGIVEAELVPLYHRAW